MRSSMSLGDCYRRLQMYIFSRGSVLAGIKCAWMAGKLRDPFEHRRCLSTTEKIQLGGAVHCTGIYI